MLKKSFCLFEYIQKLNYFCIYIKNNFKYEACIIEYDFTNRFYFCITKTNKKFCCMLFYWDIISSKDQIFKYQTYTKTLSIYSLLKSYVII